MGKKRKPKKKRPYRMSEEARNKRRQAAVKDGDHAGLLSVNSLGAPCLQSTCPVSGDGGCDYKEALEAGDDRPSASPVKFFADEATHVAYMDAWGGWSRRSTKP